MAEFLKVKLGTTPSSLLLTVHPKIVNSTQVQFQVESLPEIEITHEAVGDGWQQFNANVSSNLIDIVTDLLRSHINTTLKNAATTALNKNASFNVPPIPLKVGNISITLKPSDMKMSTFDGDYLMITSSITIE